MMDWSIAIPSGLAGAIFTFLGNMTLVAYRGYLQKKRAEPVLEKKFANDEQKALAEQIRMLLKASEDYRNEVREDLDRMKQEMSDMSNRHEEEMRIIRTAYDTEMEEMQRKITELTEEVMSYRRENGALHLLLKDKGIDVPVWITSSTGKKGS
jgi:chromosome condensin MukBEF ATPase and DNA-binding subunit MukB